MPHSHSLSHSHSHSHSHRHRRHQHRSKHSADTSELGKQHSKHRRGRRDGKRGKRANSEQRTAQLTDGQQQSGHTAPFAVSAVSAVAAVAAVEPAAIIEQWVRSWAGSSTAAESISKVADKVRREWGGKDRTGVELRDWLTANHKRRAEARALLVVYEKKVHRGANSNGDTL